jgi:hypothetical protein
MTREGIGRFLSPRRKRAKKEKLYRGDAGREKKSPAAHWRSIFRRIVKFRARAGSLIIEVTGEAERRRRKEGGDRTRDVTRV